jgi:hypothetical protein
VRETRRGAAAVKFFLSFSRTCVVAVRPAQKRCQTHPRSAPCNYQFDPPCYPILGRDGHVDALYWWGFRSGLCMCRGS